MPETFRIAIAPAALEDLSARLRAARLPRDGASDWKEGTSPAYLRELLAYWRDEYDWPAQQARLNRMAHFRCEVDGTMLHFVHEKGRGPAPFPILLTHGYPDSFFRFDKLVGLLADPGAHGADPADAFDVVVPSLPGYAFSEPRRQSGGLFGFGDLLHELMTGTLGYRRFAAHGGDWGSTITEHLARSHASSVAAIHLTDVPFWHMFQKPANLTAAERKYLERSERWQKEDGAYAMIQGTRPRSLAVGLNDSPAGLAAWLAEKYREWSDCGGDLERRFPKDDLLTQVMIYWVTGTIGTSFQPYRDVMDAGALRWIEEAARKWLGSSDTPAAFAIFPKDISSPPREWAERFFNVRRWTEMPAGGHFAAFEEPERLAADIREFFRPLRSA